MADKTIESYHTKYGMVKSDPMVNAVENFLGYPDVDDKYIHPIYKKRVIDWKFFDLAYNGGRDFINLHLEKQSSFEQDGNLIIRKKKAYYPNYVKQIIDILVSYLCNINSIRNREDYPAKLRNFSENIDNEGNSIHEFFESVGTETLKDGLSGILVDTNKTPELMEEFGRPLSYKDEVDLGLRPYLKLIKSKDILNVAFEKGTFNIVWVLIKQDYYDNQDFNNIQGLKTRYILYQKDFITFYEGGIKDENKNDSNKIKNNLDIQVKKTKITKRTIKNDLGEIPFVFATTQKCKHPFNSLSIVEDISRIDKCIMNNLSLLDQIITDQTFSQKIVETDEGEDIQDEDVNQMSTKKTQTVPTGNKVYYVAPDASQAEVIIKKVERDIKEIYRKVSLMDNDDSKQESGISKSFNFSNFNATLGRIASILENTEKKALTLFYKFMTNNPNEIKQDIEKINPKYNKTFDVFSVHQDLVATLDILEITKDISPTAIELLMNKLISKQLPELDLETKEKIKKEIKENTKKYIASLTEQTGVPDKDNTDPNLFGSGQLINSNMNNFKNSVNLDKEGGNFNQ